MSLEISQARLEHGSKFFCMRPAMKYVNPASYKRISKDCVCKFKAVQSLLSISVLGAFRLTAT